MSKKIVFVILFGLCVNGALAKSDPRIEAEREAELEKLMEDSFSFFVKMCPGGDNGLGKMIGQTVEQLTAEELVPKEDNASIARRNELLSQASDDERAQYNKGKNDRRREEREIKVNTFVYLERLAEKIQSLEDRVEIYEFLRRLRQDESNQQLLTSYVYIPVDAVLDGINKTIMYGLQQLKDEDIKEEDLHDAINIAFNKMGAQCDGNLPNSCKSCRELLEFLIEKKRKIGQQKAEMPWWRRRQ